MIFQLLQVLFKKYGLLRGLRIFFDYQFLQRGVLRLPDFAHPIYYRPGTIDRYTIKEVLFNEEYDIPLPFAHDDQLTIIDGGANIGYTSVFFANKFPKARILAIEPETENFKMLQKNTADYPQIEGRQTGIWSKSTHLAVRDRGFGLRGFVVEEVPAEDPDGFPAVSIPDLIKAHGVPDILKLDIEGSEKEVFAEGFEPWLSQVKCLIVEVHDNMIAGTAKSVFSAMVNYDFTFSMRGDNLIFVKDDTNQP